MLNPDQRGGRVDTHQGRAFVELIDDNEVVGPITFEAWIDEHGNIKTRTKAPPRFRIWTKVQERRLNRRE